MSYTALYRKFRPARFEDVKGQDHIVTTLRNQIRAGRLNHAYLFCGTRGTGKTTVAKIFAKAVNCEHPVDGNPCGECAACRAIEAGASLNVVEIDAASNNGVDNIRQIREEVSYRPTSGRYKVYILDEVHMLSPGASNALLKTLEEPPEYVIFILATTDPERLTQTILSRCQRYDFHRITIATIAARLRELTDAEGVQAEDRALRYIAQMGDGSMRDAISLLDQCIAFYMGQELTFDRVLTALGEADTSAYAQLLAAIYAQDVAAAIRKLNDLYVEGRDMTQLVTGFIGYLRNLLLLQSSGDSEDLLEVSSDQLETMGREAGKYSEEVLMRYIRVLSELSSQIRYASQKRVLVEVALIKLCRPQMEVGYDAYEERLQRAEHTIEQLQQQLQDAVISPTPHTPRPKKAPAPKQTPAPLPPPLPEELEADLQKLDKNWKSIVNLCRGNVEQVLKEPKPILSWNADGTLDIATSNNGISVDFVNGNLASSKDTLEKAISDCLERSVKVRVRYKQPEEFGQPEDSVPDGFKQINADIGVEE